MLRLTALVDGCNRDTRETVCISVLKSLCLPLLNGMDFFFLVLPVVFISQIIKAI